MWKKNTNYDEKDIENFIRSVLDGIDNALGKNKYISSDDGVDFNLAVVKTKTGSSGFKIFVAEAEGKYSSETMSTVKFTVKKRPDKPTFHMETLREECTPPTVGRQVSRRETVQKTVKKHSFEILVIRSINSILTKPFLLSFKVIN